MEKPSWNFAEPPWSKEFRGPRLCPCTASHNLQSSCEYHRPSETSTVTNGQNLFSQPERKCLTSAECVLLYTAEIMQAFMGKRPAIPRRAILPYGFGGRCQHDWCEYGTDVQALGSHLIGSCPASCCSGCIYTGTRRSRVYSTSRAHHPSQICTTPLPAPLRKLTKSKLPLNSLSELLPSTCQRPHADVTHFSIRAMACLRANQTENALKAIWECWDLQNMTLDDTGPSKYLKHSSDIMLLVRITCLRLELGPRVADSLFTLSCILQD